MLHCGPGLKAHLNTPDKRDVPRYIAVRSSSVRRGGLQVILSNFIPFLKYRVKANCEIEVNLFPYYFVSWLLLPGIENIYSNPTPIRNVLINKS